MHDAASNDLFAKQVIAATATILVILGIYGLFRVDRNEERISKAVWVPFVWLAIAMSRPVGSWADASGGWAAVANARSETYLEGSPVDRAILMLLILCGVFVLSRRAQQTKAFLAANAAIIIFLLYCLVSISWAEYPVVAFKRWTRGVADVVMVLVILTERDGLAALQWILSRLGYLLVPLSVLFIRFYPELGRAYTMSGSPMWTGVCTDKNGLGALCMIAGIGILWRWMATYSNREVPYRKRQLIAMGSVFAMVLYLLSVVDSKTALMCFLIAAVSVTIRGLFQKPAAVVAFATGTVAGCYAVLFLGVGSGALEAIGRDASLTGRTDVWQAVLSYVENPWFGAGYENFWMGDKLGPLTGLGGNQAHNGYLEIYLNLGWVGLIFLSALIVVGFRNVLSTFRSDPEVGRLKVAFFVICLIYNFSEATFKMNAPVWLTFLWATMATPTRWQTSPLPRVSGVVSTATATRRFRRTAARPRLPAKVVGGRELLGK